MTRERHRSIHLGLLHGDSDGFVEIAAGPRPAGGKLRITTRKDAGHFLPGGASGEAGWLEALLALVARHHDAGDEVCVGPAVRRSRGAAKTHVEHTNWLWIDVDGRDGLPVLRRLLRHKAPHMVLESAGSGGVHCYWRLAAPLQARTEANGPGGDWPGWLTSGATSETIERAHERLIYALGYEWRNGRPIPTIADGACKDRSRVMRVAGTVNGKTGKYARILWADFALPPWPLRALIGDLPDPPKPKVPPQGRGRVREPRRPVQAHRAGRVLPAARPDRGPAARARLVPEPRARRRDTQLPRRQGRERRLVLSRLRGRRCHLRPGLRAARRPHRPMAARGAVSPSSQPRAPGPRRRLSTDGLTYAATAAVTADSPSGQQDARAGGGEHRH